MCHFSEIEAPCSLQSPSHTAGGEREDLGESLHPRSLVRQFCDPYLLFPGGTVVKNLPTMQETWVQSLVWEDPLEKEMAAHSTIRAWEISRTEEPGGL